MAMESIPWQEIAAFSRAQVELDLGATATVKWCGLRIDSDLTPQDVARHFTISRHENPDYKRALRCHLAPVAGAIGAREVAALGPNVSFGLPAVAATDGDYRLVGSLAFAETAWLERGSFRFTMSCAGQSLDAAILLFPAPSPHRGNFRQQLQLARASITSAEDPRDSRNCPLRIIYGTSKPRRKRFFGLWRRRNLQCPARKQHRLTPSGERAQRTRPRAGALWRRVFTNVCRRFCWLSHSQFSSFTARAARFRPASITMRPGTVWWRCAF